MEMQQMELELEIEIKRSTIARPINSYLYSPQ